MSYASLVEYKAGLLAAGFPKDAPFARIEILYAYYQHARGQKALIIGRLADTQALVDVHGTAFEGGRAALLLTPKGYNETMTKIQGKKWSIWLNDSFILGGIHSHADFYLVSNADALDHLDPGAEHVFTVTQRELIGLITFGYSQGQKDHPNGLQYKCTNARLADAATFKSYCDEVLSLKNALMN
jgi:hypothetical protein